MDGRGSSLARLRARCPGHGGAAWRRLHFVNMGFVVKAASEGRRFRLDYVAGRRFLEARLGPTEVWPFEDHESALAKAPGRPRR